MSILVRLFSQKKSELDMKIIQFIIKRALSQIETSPLQFTVTTVKLAMTRVKNLERLFEVEAQRRKLDITIHLKSKTMLVSISICSLTLMTLHTNGYTERERSLFASTKIKSTIVGSMDQTGSGRT